MVHSNCNICSKKTFFSKNEFFQAHGGKIDFIPTSPWVDKIINKGKKNFPIFVYKSECKVCKLDNPPNHKKSCKYYWELKSIITPEIFEWENYWKWWFGVLSLTDDDLKSNILFGKYE